MQETITNLIVRDPAVTKAIHYIKKQLKDRAVAQKEGKKNFRAASSRWTKLSWKERIGGDVFPPSFKDQSMTITALHIIYGKLRETKRPHLNEVAWKNYFHGEKETSTHYYRRQAYEIELKCLEAEYPAAFAKIGKETF